MKTASKIAPVLKNVTIEVTDRCNLNCSYCFNNSSIKGARELSLGEIKRIAEIGTLRGASSFLLTGGEITLVPHAAEALRHIVGLGAEVNMLSNGTNIKSIDRETISSLRRVQISLDSADKGVHDSKRGKGSHDAALKAIDYARSCDAPVEISITVSSDRMGEMEGVAKIAYETGSKVLVRLLQAIGRASGQADGNITDKIARQRKGLLPKFGDIFVEDFAMYVPVLGKDHDRIATERGYLTVLPDGAVRGTGINLLQIGAEQRI
ncbi:MAG: radical SAM protein [Candidatus Micrarchaeota archaeon]|nr:radical SAM protein [Candidatus Micrarchaeota archaeon]MDE1848049.1 radical SAM protein [Candidatus Micrarchaeota archaeon]MDE1864720.1 radical SAM protein [Candidatus Micrarchaeota archaeon]